jgi:hypothetical protein
MSYKIRVQVASRLVVVVGVMAVEAVDENEWAHLTGQRADSDKNIRNVLIVASHTTKDQTRPEQVML